MVRSLGFGLGLALAAVGGGLAVPATAAETDAAKAAAAPADEEAAAWKELQAAMRLPAPPQGPAAARPTAEQQAELRKQRAAQMAGVAEKVKAFRDRFPNSSHSEGARRMELQMLQNAVGLGHAAAKERLRIVEEELLKDPATSENDRVRLLGARVQMEAMARQSEGEPAMVAVLEKGARDLMRQYPTNALPYQMLMSVLTRSEGEAARKLAAELRENPNTPERVRQSAAGQLKKIEALGKPLALKFTAVDGREVDVAKMSGKVVLIDFWATWCGPCVAELPKVKAAYERLHPKGFEIVGLSFDQKKEALTAFVEKEHMTWPQFFDGKGWQNQFGVEFGINAIPAMWLVDKKGVLRDLNARGDLEAKVEKLLAE